LNRWRAYDPAGAIFLQPDPSDLRGRSRPEGYALSRWNPVGNPDSTGLASGAPDSFEEQDFADDCSISDQYAILAALNLAYETLLKCTKGVCSTANGRRLWQSVLYSARSIRCPKNTTHDGYDIAGDGLATDTLRSAALTYGNGRLGTHTEVYPASISDYYVDPNCLAMTLAHERLHDVTINGTFPAIALDEDASLLSRVELPQVHEVDTEEAFIDDATARCFGCKVARDNYKYHGDNPIGFGR
jgi:hypothetical protein